MQLWFHNNPVFFYGFFFSVTLRGQWKNSERTSFPVNVASTCPTWKGWLLCWARSPKRLESSKVGVPASTVSYISIVIQSMILFAPDFIYLWKTSNFRSLYIVVIFTLKHKIPALFPHLQIPVFLLEDICIYFENLNVWNQNMWKNNHCKPLYGRLFLKLRCHVTAFSIYSTVFLGFCSWISRHAEGSKESDGGRNGSGCQWRKVSTYILLKPVFLSQHCMVFCLYKHRFGVLF